MLSSTDDLRYNGLTELTEGLAADAYFDPRHYGRELQRIWYRNWIYVVPVERTRGREGIPHLRGRRSTSAVGAG